MWAFMKTPKDYLSEMDADIQKAQLDLDELRAARDAFAESIGEPAGGLVLNILDDEPAPRRRRRTKDEMVTIKARIGEVYRDDTSRQPADVWRELIKEGLLEDSSHDRDTVSKEIRLVKAGEVVAVAAVKDAERQLSQQAGLLMTSEEG